MKHAYLIMAHIEFNLLENLLSVLDYPNNDIFVHIDKKVGEYTVKYHPKYSKIFVIPNEQRVDIRWGEDSQIYGELLLYRYASQMGKYDYYHLLSGIDMPIKSQQYIHDFFEEHKGFEFIGLTKNAYYTKERLMYFHFFITRKDTKRKLMHTIVIAIQKMLQIKRGNKEWNILAKGTNWCSLTHAAVQYILNHEDFIRKRFAYTLMCDEVYKQTLLMNSSLASHLYDKDDEGRGCMRLIDWKRRYPYTWTMNDWNELMDSDKLFARKFSSQHQDLVDRLTKKVKQE